MNIDRTVAGREWHEWRRMWMDDQDTFVREVTRLDDHELVDLLELCVAAFDTHLGAYSEIHTEILRRMDWREL